jgi:site-specific recombinase XerD
MSSSFKILFYVKRSQLNKNGKGTIMIRVTLNSQRTQFSSKLEIEPELWDGKAGKITGKSNAAGSLNNTMDGIRTTLRNIYYELDKNGTVTAEKIRGAFLGHHLEQQSLLALYDRHNEDVKKLVGKSVAKATLEKYERTRNRLAGYLYSKYKLSDIPLKDINSDFISGFDVYLRSNCNCNANTTAKFMQFFKRVIIIARNNGWIIGDPFANYKIRLKRVDRGYLAESELQVIIKKKLASERLEQVRDIFIFSCYCGLAYIDMKNLKKENIRKSFDGSLWIMTRRKKTDTTVNVPLLAIPQMILNKYKGKTKDGQLLPVISNQKLNSYLKEIGDVCGINKNLTFHSARHNFGTHITLSQGVPIETVSRMMGHKSITTTQIYAKVTDKKVDEPMKRLRE